MSENGIVEEECGCKYNWNDHFYESRCIKCAEIDEAEENVVLIGWVSDDPDAYQRWK